MKNKFLFLISSLLYLISFSFSYAAETVNIPDNNFKAALIALGVDTNDDSIISFEEAAAVTSLDVNSKSIADLTGIKAFVNLTVLNCYWNDLTELDVSGLSGLQELRCFGNRLDSLDVTHNPELIKLMCYDNPIGTIDVSSNTQLTHLYCDNNQLTSLDVSANTALQYLYCKDNEITSIDLSKQTVLKELICNSNLLDSLDVSNCPELVLLRCHNNQLSGLNVTKNPLLTDLMCGGNLISELDLLSNPELLYLLCGSNHLISLDLSSNTKLITISLGSMPDLVEICVWKLPFPAAGVSLDTTGSPNIRFSTDCLVENVYIPDANFKAALIALGLDKNGDDEISYNEAEAADSIDVHLKNIADLTGIEAFVNLTFLWCYHNELTSFDISGLTALRDLDCGANHLSSLDVSDNTALLELRCYTNQLTSLDLSSLTNLTYLDCGDNQLTELDVSANTLLQLLLCYVNQLASLDISGNTDLEFLNISLIPSLNQVCVWEMPFPPAGTTVMDNESPNVVYSQACSVSILNEKSILNGLKVYPNPACDMLYIDFPGTAVYTFSISDMRGKTVFSGKSNQDKAQINLESFSKGLYILKVQTSDTCIKHKFSVM